MVFRGIRSISMECRGSYHGIPWSSQTYTMFQCRAMFRGMPWGPIEVHGRHGAPKIMPRTSMDPMAFHGGTYGLPWNEMEFRGNPSVAKK